VLAEMLAFSRKKMISAKVKKNDMKEILKDFKCAPTAFRNTKEKHKTNALTSTLQDHSPRKF